ncbi:heterokaryon incompatibility protein [Diplodia corticola]|uniref:Heterokaryon incompatibility protein n=1 Tax=Diplodia corticola TaxID=236234 RepID=A0A1J9RBI8_9PEZI|nr:heterokaryon incompatibility protein [Diplodia corticola]OJD38958.1 heterokaryon incompatibility protein [Diplodia corticola]
MESFCNACSNIFIGGKSRKRDVGGATFLHHESFAAFQDALRTGCFFCEMMERAYVNEHGGFSEQTRNGSQSFKITYIFETDVEWLGYVSDDNEEEQEEVEETDARAVSEQHESGRVDDSDSNSIVEEPAETFDTFQMLLVHFWRGEHDRTVKDFWLLPTQHAGAYASEKDPGIEVVYSHPIEDNTGSEPNRLLIRKWIDYCTKHDDACPLPPSTAVRLPTRVIDVGNTGDGQVRLHVTQESDIKHGRYISLSHRWGEVNLPKCTKSSLSSLQQGFDVAGLPKTFRDAIEVTRELEVRFLWIDSLCILQDSAEDWAQEAGMMGEVYRNCYVNIAATAAQDSDGGLFFDRRKRDVEHLEVEIDWFSENNSAPASEEAASRPRYVSCHCWDPDLWSFEVELAVVNTRGWVAQERLFSPRILHFGANQLLWECSARAACEMSPGGDPDLSIGPQLRPWKHLADCFRDAANTTPMRSLTRPQRFKKWQAWWDFVEAYTTRDFTYSSDKLIAISAVAKAMMAQHEGVPEDYIAGLWAWWPELDLCWHVSHNRQPPLSFRTTVRPADGKSAWRAPSWSWASVDGPVIRAYVDRGDEAVLLVRVLDARVVALRGRDRTGQLEDASLEVECRVFSAAWSTPPLADVSRDGAKLLDASGNGVLTGSISFDDFHQASAVAASDSVRVVCLPITQIFTQFDDPLGQYFVHGLLVEVVPGDALVYRRVGHFMVNGSIDQLYAVAEKEGFRNTGPVVATLL